MDSLIAQPQYPSSVSSEEDLALFNLVKQLRSQTDTDNDVMHRIATISHQALREAAYQRCEDDILQRVQQRLSSLTDEELYISQCLEYRLSRLTRSAEERLSRLWRLCRSRPEVANFVDNWMAARDNSVSTEEIENEFEKWQIRIAVIEKIAELEDWELSEDEQMDREGARFEKFMELPLEIRLQIWYYAFPARVLNIIYDRDDDEFRLQHHQSTLAQVHRETRQLYQHFFGTSTHEAKILFDPVRDTLACSWLSNEDPRLNWPAFPFGENVQNIAISAHCFRELENIKISDIEAEQRALILGPSMMESFVTRVVERFPQLKTLYITINELANPYSRGRIRFFPFSGKPTNPVTSMEISSLWDDWKDAVHGLKESKFLQERHIDVQLVGAWQGGSRRGYGSMLNGIEDEDDDEVYSSSDDRYGSDSDASDISDDHYRSLEYFGTDEDDSDGGDVDTTDNVSNEETDGLRADEIAYKHFSEGENGRRIHGMYQARQGQWVKPDYYSVRRELPGRCYPVYHPDGSYTN